MQKNNKDSSAGIFQFFKDVWNLNVNGTIEDPKGPRILKESKNYGSADKAQSALVASTDQNKSPDEAPKSVTEDDLPPVVTGILERKR